MTYASEGALANRSPNDSGSNRETEITRCRHERASIPEQPRIHTRK
jgi:hypothetical protein